MGPGPPLHAPRPSQLGGLTEPLMASVSSPGRQPSNPLLRQPADPGVRASGPGSPGPWLGGWAGQSPGCGDPVCACACTGRCAYREGRAPRAAADARVGTRPLRPAPTPSWCPPRWFAARAGRPLTQPGPPAPQGACSPYGASAVAWRRCAGSSLPSSQRVLRSSGWPLSWGPGEWAGRGRFSLGLLDPLSGWGFRAPHLPRGQPGAGP